MATSQMNEVFQHLRKTVGLREGAGQTDGQLLADYINRRDEAALATIVLRHGPMVWGVCRRLLRNHHDAEDAFQVTFLVLVRKAASIASRELLANWLYGVAFQTALKARATAAKRRARERQVEELPELEVIKPALWLDLQPLLDQELSCLPDKYRIPVVLCDLEGKTRKEAAQQLGWPEGTVAGRLARARAMLAKRLGRHGLAVSGGVLGTVVSQNMASAGVPASVMSNTIKTGTLLAAGQVAGISPHVAALIEGVMKAMLMTKLKAGAAVLLTLCMLAVTCGMLAVGNTSARTDSVEEAAAKADDKPKDAEGEAYPLTVTIKPQPKHVRVKEPFKVDLRVANSSKSAQSFQVMNCSWYEHWKSSTNRVCCEGWDCAENSVEIVKLEPGKTYEKTLPLLLLAGKPLATVSFKMGFTPIGSKQTYWSNEVTLMVEPEDTSKQDMVKLQGTWTAVSMERDGKALSDQEVKKLDIRLTIKDNEFMLMPLASTGPEHFPHGTFRIDPAKKPKGIDFSIDLPFLPAKKTSAVLGIYEVDGDSLKLFQGRPDQERPTEFKTTPKSGLEIIVFRRGMPPGPQKEGEKVKPEGGKEVKGLVALAEVVEHNLANDRPYFEVLFTLKNVSDKPITICDYAGNQPLKVQWVGPDGKTLRSDHYGWLRYSRIASLTEKNFVTIAAGGVRRIVAGGGYSGIIFQPTPEKPLRVGNVTQPGKHRVTVSYTSMEDGKKFNLESVWTGTVTANEVVLNAK